MDSASRSTAGDRVLTAQGVSSSESSQPRAAGSSTMRAAVISMGGDLFTIDLKSVREVFVVESITPVPGMPSGLVGVTNLRGTVIPLLDLRPMFGLDAVATLRYAIVVQHLNWQVGLLVDAVPEIRTIAKDQFLPAPAGTGEGAFPLVSTVVKLEDRLRGVLETSVVLSHFEGKS
ncbi:MAG: purine-binding chemotaxis protein CheW [Nitrospirae bacterium]|nr:purine-binding chemotaxis protein CheW [Nitrospirota bacterium]